MSGASLAGPMSDRVVKPVAPRTQTRHIVGWCSQIVEGNRTVLWRHQRPALEAVWVCVEPTWLQ